jgi:dTMP kinase
MDAMFITFEGIDGCGKSTQAQLLAQHLTRLGHEVVSTREPGGTSLAEEIRALLLNSRQSGDDIAPRAEALLFAAARAQHAGQLIAPALARGAWVLCDRFTDSSLAYQGAALDLGEDAVRALNLFATAGLAPRLTLLFDLPTEEALRRRAQSRGESDRIESRGSEFQERVRQGFLKQAARDPKRIAVLDAAQDAAQVHAQVLQVLEQVLASASSVS